MNLTPRELEILQLLTYGHTNRQIAAATKINTTDVIDHIADLYRKFGAHDRESLAHAWAQRPAADREVGQ
jgi:DNA-binding CsgD family transcriptional regulator